jgi:NADP-dependent 3-hydroxy acid dehydrogenase YdfG
MDQKTVLITGASTGIGHATAKNFIKEGHRVYAFARRLELMDDLVEMGGRAFFMDVREDQSVKEGVEKMIKAEGRVDVLVNNAGYAAYGSLEDLSIEKAKAQFETNIFGYVRLIQAVLPGMRAQKKGRIINVTSTAGKINLPIVTWYGASKFALEGLLDAFRNEVSGLGIKVVIIEPGFIDTDLYRVAWELLDQVKISPNYQKMVQAFKADFQKRQTKAPTGEVIAKAIYQASLTRSPKTRYALPGDAKTYLFLRKILSDKMVDKMIKFSLNLK